jgi:hypothetical protein
MTTKVPVRLLCTATAILLLGATTSGCRIYAWSTYSHIPYQQWRDDDGARLQLLRAIAQGSTAKSQSLSRGPGVYQLRQSDHWAMKARIAQEAARLLEASPRNPSPRCARILSKIRWELDFRYPCVVGWATNMLMRSYVQANPARRANLLRRIKRFGYNCGPTGNWLQLFLKRLRRASACTTVDQPTPPPSPLRSVTPPPAPGHAPTPNPVPTPVPPRKKR